MLLPCLEMLVNDLSYFETHGNLMTLLYYHPASKALLKMRILVTALHCTYSVIGAL